LQAWDPDEAGPNNLITYSIVGGVDANSFTLVAHQHGDSGTADILTKISLDFESRRKKFDIVVRASSPPLRNDVHVEIHVQDGKELGNGGVGNSGNVRVLTRGPCLLYFQVNDNAPVLKPFEIVLNNYKDHFPVGPIGKVPAVDADLTDRVG